MALKKHFELITPKRIFLREGTFRVSTQKRTLSEAQVFLFSDLIVITKRHKRAETFLVLNKIPLDSVIVRTQKELINQKGGCTLCVLLALAPLPTHPPLENSFELVHMGDVVYYLESVGQVEEVRIWVDEISRYAQEAVEVKKKKN